MVPTTDSNKIYPWQRFWCPTTGNINLGDRGFLSDPSSEYGKFTNPDLCSLEEILSKRFLGLLGEPGIGKSKTLELEKQKIEAAIEKANDRSLWINLNSIGTEERFIQEIFDSPEFKSLALGTHNLHIFLDSLDEALLRIDVLAALLLEKLKKQPTDRIFLRVSCRTAIWPQSLEKGAQSIWPENIGIYELAALRRVDVENAAKIHGIDSQLFLEEISKKEATAFAIKPVSLIFLLDIFIREKSLPSSQTSLYQAGCTLLCEEPNQSHRETKIKSTLIPVQKLELASRIAAITIFSNKTAIVRGSTNRLSEEVIHVDQLLGDYSFKHGPSIVITNKIIDEVLDTGLFSSRGPDRFGWSHKTYAEFLAANYLCPQPLDQICSLLFSPDDEEQKIIPQLQETAGWLSAMIPELFHKIINKNPEILILSDVATDMDSREKIVSSLIDMHRRKQILNSFELSQRVHKLAHPHLDQQVRGILLNENENEELRNFVIDLIEDCNVSSLINEVPSIVLNKNESLLVRAHAAFALCRAGSKENKMMLKPLIHGSPEDSKDELKGCALRALWPEQVTAKEVFEVLSLPLKDNYIGSYDYFISHQLTLNILPADWEHALNWVASYSHENMSFATERLIEDVFVRAWDHIDCGDNLKAYARAVKVKLKKSFEFLRDKKNSEFSLKVRTEHGKRKKLLEELIPSFIAAPDNLFWLIYSNLLITNDVPWMAEKVCTSDDQSIKTLWCKAVELACDWYNPVFSEVVFNACQTDAFMAKAFDWFLKPVDLSSPQAFKMRKDHKEVQEIQTKHQPRPFDFKNLVERIQSRLTALESGDYSSWWQLNRDLTINLKNSTYGSELKADLTGLWNWDLLDEKTKQRVVLSANNFIHASSPKSQKVTAEGSYFLHDLAGYRALYLLAKESSDLFESLPSQVWINWAAPIFAYPKWGHEDDDAIHDKLLLKAHQSNPARILNSILETIKAANEKHETIFIQRQINICWSSNLEKALIKILRDGKLKPKIFGEILRLLLEKKNTAAEDTAKAFIKRGPPKDAANNEKYFIAAQELLVFQAQIYWGIIWKQITNNTSFGQAFLKHLSYEDRRGSKLLNELKENEIANIYIWLTEQYRYEDDGERNGGVVSPHDSIIMWRNAVLDYLIGRGTTKSCEELKRIMKHFPRYEWLKRCLLRGLLNRRSKSWVPPKPEWILHLIRDKSTRWIQSGNDLLNLILQCLKKAEVDLQGETPQSRYLWNTKPKIIPKDENDFSDWVKNYLDANLAKKGIVLGREVEIRKGYGKGSGQITDIHVTALVPKVANKNEFEPIKAIIEVKGCWNNGLYTDMESQLKDRYLKDNFCKHGIYLVGWYNCDAWDEKDRTKRAPKKDILQITNFLAEQAKLISDENATISSCVINTGFK